MKSGMCFIIPTASQPESKLIFRFAEVKQWNLTSISGPITTLLINQSTSIPFTVEKLRNLLVSLILWQSAMEEIYPQVLPMAMEVDGGIIICLWT